MRAILALGLAAVVSGQAPIDLGSLEPGTRLTTSSDLPPSIIIYVSFMQPSVPTSFTVTVSSSTSAADFTVWANQGSLFNFTRRWSIEAVSSNSRSFTAYTIDPTYGIFGGQEWYLHIESSNPSAAQSMDISVAREPLPSAQPTPRYLADLGYGTANAQSVALLPAGQYVYYRFTAPTIDGFTVEVTPTAGTNADLYLSRIMPVGANFTIETSSTNLHSAPDSLVVMPGSRYWSSTGGPYYLRVLAVTSCGYSIRVFPFMTPSRSGSQTQTTSFSRTQTATPSSTRSNSATASLSSSNTATGSWTASITASWTASRTATPSLTASNTKTASRTRTASRSSSETATASNTGTASSSQTGTQTSSSSQTSSPTQTATHTRTSSRTSTSSKTASLTSSITATASLTASRTATASLSSTATWTASITSTSSRSSTKTSSGSRTSTPSSSQTASQTASSSATGTPSSSQTQTPTETSTPSRSSSETATPSRTSSGTARPTYSSQPSPRQVLPLGYGADGAATMEYLTSGRPNVFYSFSAPGVDSFRIEIRTLRGTRAAMGLSSFLGEDDFLFNEQATASATAGVPGVISVNVSDPILWLASGGPYYLSVGCMSPTCGWVLSVVPLASPTATPSPSATGTIPSTSPTQTQTPSARPTTATVTQTPSGTVTPTPAPSFRSIIDLPYGTSPGHTVRYMPKNVAGGGQMYLDYRFSAPPGDGFTVTLSLGPSQWADLWLSTRDRDTYDVRGVGTGTAVRSITIPWNSTFWRATGGPYWLRVLAYTDLSYTIDVLPIASPSRTPSAAVTRSPLETHTPSISRTATLSGSKTGTASLTPSGTRSAGSTHSRSRTPVATDSATDTPFPTRSRSKTPPPSITRTPTKTRRPSSSGTPFPTRTRTATASGTKKKKAQRLLRKALGQH